MAQKQFDFKEELKKGNRGEELFKKIYREKLEVIDANYADFKTPSGKILELKTDYYDMNTSTNFFVERYSDASKKSPGSFWQSQNKGVQIFCYMFIKNQTYFEFTDLPNVIVRLEEILKSLKYVTIKNRGWTAIGYKVPREELKDLYTIHTFEESK